MAKTMNLKRGTWEIHSLSCGAITDFPSLPSACHQLCLFDSGVRSILIPLLTFVSLIPILAFLQMSFATAYLLSDAEMQMGSACVPYIIRLLTWNAAARNLISCPIPTTDRSPSLARRTDPCKRVPWHAGKWKQTLACRSNYATKTCCHFAYLS